MTEEGLRERKKRRTRGLIAATARRLFLERGFAATTVEDICEASEVSISTFFRYFDSKEAAAFPDHEDRVGFIHRTLTAAPEDEPLHRSIRRATVALAEATVAEGDGACTRYRLLSREPALAAFNAELQSRVARHCIDLVAERLGVDPAKDVRPGVVVGSAFSAVNSAWNVWIASDYTADLPTLVNEAHDVIDAGMAAAGTLER